ncbi:MAG TPA: hypothetical protein VNR38_07005 [Ureibacillus sp.]|nr:hypothetical protein [Ureibacillus sp.]
MREYNVHEVLAILQKYYITDSQQMVARWIREGKIQGIRSENRKEGYRVSEDELFEFIEEQRPGLPSIIEVYESYVKQLKPDFQEENITETQEILNKSLQLIENENDELRERVLKLENALTDLQQEKQILEMELIETLELTNGLKEENNFLLDEIEILSELFKITDEENKKLKDLSSKKINLEIKDDDQIKKGNTLKKELSFEEFKDLSEESVSRIELNLEKGIIDNHLRSVYERIFENGKIKSNLITDDGSITCPYTERVYKQQKRLINNAVLHYFEKHSGLKPYQEELEITVAND